MYKIRTNEGKTQSEETRSHNCAIYVLDIIYKEFIVNSTWFLMNQPSLWKSRSLVSEDE